MTKGIIIITIAAAVGLILGVWIGMGITESQIEEIYFESDDPMLLVEFSGWGENIDDSSEILFEYFVYNYGNLEAKNVEIKCDMMDADEIIIQKYIFNIGNIASNSYEYQQSETKKPDVYSQEHFGLCYVNSADGDYINLKNRLNDI